MKEKCKEGIIFDGELYNHSLKDNFNQIQSLVSKKNPTEAELKIIDDSIEYHIYDYIDTNLNQEQRIINLAIVFNEIYDSAIKLVHSITVQSQEELDIRYGELLEHGYEGQMIRKINGLYENKRSKNLLKRKEFQDAEYPIVDIEEGLGNRSGMAGAVVVQLPNGKTCGCGIKGGVSVNQELFNNKDQYIGKLATVRFQNLTPDGVPRFPVFYGIREMM
jgi:DNA ligase-1